MQQYVRLLQRFLRIPVVPSDDGNSQNMPLLPDDILGAFTKPRESRISETSFTPENLYLCAWFHFSKRGARLLGSALLEIILYILYEYNRAAVKLRAPYLKWLTPQTTSGKSCHIFSQTGVNKNLSLPSLLHYLTIDGPPASTMALEVAPIETI